MARQGFNESLMAGQALPRHGQALQGGARHSKARFFTRRHEA